MSNKHLLYDVLYKGGIKDLKEKNCKSAIEKFTKLKERLENDPAISKDDSDYSDIDERLAEAQNQCKTSPPILAIIAVLGVIVLLGAGVYFIFQPESSSEPSIGAVNTEEPLTQPTAEPITAPAEGPTTAPTVEPTVDPAEDVTTEPATEPAIQSTAEPTTALTEEPTTEPTPEPIVDPAEEATTEPTAEPIARSTGEPAAESTEEPATEPTEEPAATIDPATLSGKLAVPVFNAQTETYDLYIVSGPAWRLPPGPFQPAASQPAFSPDGSEIVFRSWGGETTSYSEQLLMRSVSGTTDQPVTRNIEDARPRWSGTQSDVILHHSRPAGLDSTIYLQGIWAGALDTPDSRQDIAIGENPTWLPDGRIVYASGTPDGIGLYVMDQAGNGLQKIWSSSNIVAPAGSPQENVVVFSNNGDLYTLPVTNGQSSPEPLTETPQSRERWPVWSPDGQYIAFVADNNRDEQWAVYVIRADGTGQTKLFDLPGSIDGRPANVPRSSGWTEEQLAWGP